MVREIPPAVYLETNEEVLEKLHECAACGFLPVDTETTGLHPITDHIVFWSFADDDHRYASKAYTLDALKLFLEESDVPLIFHNAPYDIHMLCNAGLDGEALWKRSFCTQMMSALWNPDIFHDLKSLGWRLLKIPPKKFREYDFAEMDLEDLDEENFWKLVDYAAKDAWLTISIFRIIYDDMLKTPCESTLHEWTLWEYYLEMERPLAPILWRMTRRGIQIDTDHLKSMLGPVTERLHEISSTFCQIAHEKVNLRSTQKLADLLFHKLGYDVVKKTEGGAPSTDKEAMDILQTRNPNDPLLNALAEFRLLDKLKGTYLDGLPKHAVDGAIHTNLKQATAATGRISSDKPNLQNIPVRSEEGKRIREAFIGGEGCKLVVADYGQIEMRVLAHLSGAPSVIDPILDGRDFHTLTAVQMFGVDYDAVMAAKKLKDPTEAQKVLLQRRDVAKTINFGVIYGLTSYGLIKNLKDKAGMVVSKEEAAAYLATFWKSHEDVRDFFNECLAFSEKNGFIPTHFGRIRYVYWPKDRQQWQARSEAMRRTYNTPIQGTASEIMKLAMVKLENDDRLHELNAELLLQVHDEVIFKVPGDNAKEALEIIVEDMKNPGIQLQVPYTVDSGIADNWAQAK